MAARVIITALLFALVATLLMVFLVDYTFTWKLAVKWLVIGSIFSLLFVNRRKVV